MTREAPVELSSSRFLTAAFSLKVVVVADTQYG